MLGKEESALRALDSERTNSKLSVGQSSSVAKLQASPGSFITQDDEIERKSVANLSISRGSLHSGRPESHLPITKISPI